MPTEDASVAAPQPALHIFGRDRELKLLDDAVTATVDGAGGCLVVTGLPGIGKTSLLTRAVDRARTAGLAIGAAHATELDQVAPLNTLLAALSRIGPRPMDLARLSGHAGDRFWYVERLTEAIEDYTAELPLLVVIDDAQWTDELSLLALRVLIPTLSSSPVRWLLARRPAPVRSAAQDTLDWLVGQAAEEVVLGPLDDRSVRGLCASVLDADVDATVVALADRCGGNPFLLKQLLGTLRDAGQILVSEGVATVIGDALPTGFVAAMEQRLRGLSELARRLLQAGSVLGRPFSVHTAAALMGARAVDLLPVAEEAVGAGLLTVDGEHLAFAHDLLREAIYNSTSAPVRAAMHREAATVMGAAGAAPGASAGHLIRGGDTTDRSSVEVLRRVAIEVASQAPGTAATLVLLAMDRLDPDDDERIQLSANAIGLLSSAGRVVEARELGEAALRRDLDSTTEATLLLGLAEVLKQDGNNEEAVAYAARGLSAPGVPDAIRAQLYAIQAHALMYDLDDVSGVDRAGAEAHLLGIRSGDAGAAALGLTARTLAAQVEGRLADALTYARDAVALVDRIGGSARRWHPRIWFGSALTSADLFAEAEQTYTKGRREADELGTAWSQPLWHYYYATLLSLRGRLDEAVAEAEAGLRIADQLSARQLGVPILALLTRLAIVRGQQALAREHMRGMQALLDDGITAAPEDIAWVRVVYADAEDNPVHALNAVADVVRRFPGRLLLFANDPTAAPTLVRLALRAGDLDVARATAQAARELAGRNPAVASLAGAARHATGLLDGDPRDLHAAVAHFEQSPRPLALASAMEDAAMVEHAAGRRVRAVQLLEDALDLQRSHGAQRAVTRLERRLRTLGTHGGHPEKIESASVLTDLTRAERDVARLVGGGMTNRQVAETLFISPHTVDSHLRHIFAKLGINRRVELVRLIARWDEESIT
jgi:ATP/maltotriose-dependent transcriptional regulator MalT